MSMNIWIQKSLKLANQSNYLDALSDIYPIQDNKEETRLEKNRLQEIRKAFKTKDHNKLLTLLLEEERFPFDDPYVAFLRMDKTSVSRNPKTVRRLLSKVYSIGLDNVISGINRPKSSSRQFGSYFKNWITQNFPVVSEKEILVKNKGVFVLRGGDESLKKFVNKNFGIGQRKGLDFVMKINSHYLIGEAKFVSASGGTQDKSIRETITFVKKTKGNVIRVAVVDGVIWLDRKNKREKNQSLYQEVINLKDGRNIMSALLLKDFVNSLKKI